MLPCVSGLIVGDEIGKGGKEAIIPRAGGRGEFRGVGEPE